MSSTDGGATWTPQASGTTAALNAVNCQPGACYAAGAVANGSAVLLRGSGGTWTAQNSHAPQALTGITCLDAQQCFAGGAIGTVVTTTDGGATWTQQGNPLSGPTSALNVSTSAAVGINAAACNPGRCVFGTGADGDEMTSPLVYVTVRATTPYGQAPNLTFPADSPAISVSPASEAAHLQGTLTCQTTATDHSVGGAYPISACTGLSDPGFSVVYDYAGSSDTVLFPSATGTVTGTVPATLALSLNGRRRSASSSRASRRTTSPRRPPPSPRRRATRG